MGKDRQRDKHLYDTHAYWKTNCTRDDGDCATCVWTIQGRDCFDNFLDEDYKPANEVYDYAEDNYVYTAEDNYVYTAEDAYVDENVEGMRKMTLIGGGGK